MLQLGTTLRCNLPPRHIWIVLSDPAHTEEILLVNLTSLTDDCVDDVCILSPADFELLTHKTTVAYSRAQIGTATKLNKLIAQGIFTRITPVASATLHKIVSGARSTRQLSQSQKRLLP